MLVIGAAALCRGNAFMILGASGKRHAGYFRTRWAGRWVPIDSIGRAVQP